MKLLSSRNPFIQVINSNLSSGLADGNYGYCGRNPFIQVINSNEEDNMTKLFMHWERS